MKQLLYRLVYQPQINFLLRNVNRVLGIRNASGVGLPPTGIVRFPFGKGKVMRLNTNQTNFGTQEIYWKGGVEEYEYVAIILD